MKLLAIKKNGKYYCRENKQYPNIIPDQERLRFDIPRLPSFNDKWVIFNKLPTVAERCIPGGYKVVEYKLKQGYDTLNNIPSVLPSDAFDCIQWDDSDDCTEYKNQDVKGLYEAVKVKTPDAWELIELDIDLIDEDCEPLVNPKYNYHTVFPYYIENHDVVIHKYPCYINGDDLYALIRTAVKANLPDHCIITSDYDFSLTVKIKAPVLHEETFRADVSSMNARKPKMVDKPLRNILVTIIDIETKSRNSGTAIKRVDADNYEELEQKVDGIIQEYVDLMNWKPTVCPSCKGCGWIKQDEV